eukprot:TRINITY_DN3625_c0_g1_i1.p3 TRINITY_DN3625_c0_g1~~TRINITY_DN3625_c0_g1_i1.p3  ORF type:complete len:117 (-),score=39.49 TRINITY_DN3625_c0_g1_i1:173-523(-)
MEILDRHPVMERHLRAFAPAIARAKVVFVDGNIAGATLREVCTVAHSGAARVLFEPVSIAKSEVAVRSGALQLLDFVTPNVLELEHMYRILREQSGAPRGRPTTATTTACCATVGL